MKRFILILPYALLFGLMTLLNCNDDEPEVKPLIAFLTDESSVTEGETITVPFNMTLPSGVTPVYSLTGTAIAGIDYTHSVTPGGLVFVVQADNTQDPDESIIVTLVSISGDAQLGAKRTHTITVIEPPAVVEFQSPASTDAEGQAAIVPFTATLPVGILPTITLEGTAIEGQDFTYTIIQSGIEFTLIDDGLYDPDKTIEITITGVSGNAQLGTELVHILTITEAPFVLEFAAVVSTVMEGQEVKLFFEEEIPEGIEPLMTFGGSAEQGTDYTYTLQTDGALISTLEDGFYDPDETVVVTLTGVTGNAVLGDAVTHLVNIQEPELSIEFASASSNVLEGNQTTVSFNVELPEGVEPTFALGGSATQGADYTYTLTSNGILFNIVEDGQFESDENIIITLTGISGNAVLGSQTVHSIIIENKPLVIEFVSISSSVAEGQVATVSFNVPLSAGIVPTVSFAGSASSGIDFTHTISSSGVLITAISDGVYDPNETIVITLTDVSGNAVLGTQLTHTVTITEAPLVVEFSDAASTLAEGGGATVPFNIALPPGVLPVVSVAGTSTPGNDYTFSVTSAGIFVNATNDGLYDPDETIIITLTSVNGNAVLGTQTIHTVTITETPLVVEFVSGASTVKEGEEVVAAFNILLPAPVVPSFTLGGSAVSGVDYTHTVTQTGIVITAIDDGAYDPDKAIVITLTAVSGNAVLGTQLIHTVTLEDIPLVVEFASPSSSVAEGEADIISFNLTLPAGVVPTLTIGGTSTNGVDYSYTVTPSGIVLTAVDDDLYDPNETVIITLTGITGNAQLGSQLTHTVTITEAPLIVEFATPASGVQEGAVVAVLFEEPLPDDVVPVISVGGTATQGTDYSYSLTSAGVVITTVNDGLYDPNETIILTITGIGGNAILGSQIAHTVTITEPPLVIQFASVSSAVAEGSEVTIPFNISLPAGVVPTISLAGSSTLPDDFTYTITPTGVSITTLSDGLYDPNETIVLTLTGVSGNAVLGAQVTHTVTITETPLVIEFANVTSSAKEGESPTVAFNMVLPAGVLPTITLSGTATSGVDYTHTITPNGIQFNLAFDALFDPDETVIMTLTGVSGNAVLGTNVTHTLTITELPLTVEFQSATSSASEGQNHTVPFSLTLPAGVVPVISLSGTAVQGADYTYSLIPGGVVLNLASDGVYDPDETIVITLTGVSGNAELGTLLVHTVTVTEAPLEVEFTTVSSSVGEGSGLTVLFNIPLPAGVVPTVSLGGTATQGVDYSYTVTSTGIQITSVNDGLYDPNETIVLTLTAISGNAVLGSQITHTITLTEPPLVVEFEEVTSVVGEGSAMSVAFNITLPAGVVPTFSLGGTATQGADYSVSQTPTGLQITAVNDGTYDPNETIVITLTAISGNAVLGMVTTHTVTLTEPPLVVEFALASSTVAEGSEVTLSYNMPLPAGVTPTVSVGGTATISTDYTYTITQTGVVVVAIADGLYDPGETIEVTLTGISGNAQLGTQLMHTVTITEPPLVVEFSTASSSVQEGAAITVPFTEPLPAEVVPAVSLSGTALSGSDYTYSVTPAGIQIVTIEDGLYDPSETIVITLTGVSGNALLGTQIVHTVTVTEPQLVVQFAQNASTVGEGSAVNVAFNMTLPPEVVPTISLSGTATPGTDFSYTVTTSGIQISTIVDGLYDPNETVVITLTGISGNAILGAQTTHTVAITEPPIVVEFEAAASSVSEGEEELATYTIPLPGGVLPTVSLGGTATLGADYTYTITNLGIAVTTLADALYEPNETIVITLTGVSGNAVLGSTIVHTLTIVEPVLVVGFSSTSSTGLEGTTHTVPFITILPGEVVPDIELSGTAMQGVDYTYSITSDGIVFTLVDDGLVESDETIIINLTALSGNAEPGGITTHTVTLTETQLIVEFATGASSVLEGQSVVVPYNMVLPGGILPTVSLSGLASNPADFTYSITPSGIVIQTVEDWIPDPDETIVMTMTGVTGGAVLGTVIEHTVTITDPPAPVIEFVTLSSTVSEGGNVTLAFSAPLPAGVFPTLTLGGTATMDLDYTYSYTTNSMIVYALGDGALDPDETIVITLTGFSVNNAVEIGFNMTHTITISDMPLVIGFLSSNVRRIEGTASIAAFDLALPAGVSPIYTISGTATSGVDYTISQSSSGFILNTLLDQIYDPEETIAIELTGFTGNAILGATTTYVLTIQDEDELETPRIEIDLLWDSGDGTPGDVDMDLILWYEATPGNPTLRILSDNVGTTFEDITALSNLEDGKWGLSHVYYSGSSNNVTFTVNFRVYKGNIGGATNRATYSANYTLANINPWAETQVFYIEQYYDKLGVNYGNFTDIQVPLSGSRIRSFEYQIDPQKIDSHKLQLLKNSLSPNTPDR